MIARPAERVKKPLPAGAIHGPFSLDLSKSSPRRRALRSRHAASAARGRSAPRRTSASASPLGTSETPNSRSRSRRRVSSGRSNSSNCPMASGIASSQRGLAGIRGRPRPTTADPARARPLGHRARGTWRYHGLHEQYRADPQAARRRTGMVLEAGPPWSRHRQSSAAQGGSLAVGGTTIAFRVVQARRRRFAVSEHVTCTHTILYINASVR